MTTRYTHYNDINGQRCFIIKDNIPRQDLIDKGVQPLGTHTIVQNEDGTKQKLFPWELTEIEESSKN
jgi:hypothetical protein